MKKIIFILFIFLILLSTVKGITGNYEFGSRVTYNNMDFYVLKDTEEYVTLIKAASLTVDEVREIYTGYIYSDCGRVVYGTTSDYDTSNIKTVVNSWATNKINETDLYEDSLGYKSRLATKEEIELLNQIENTKIQCWYWTMTASSTESSTGVYAVTPDSFSAQFSYYDFGFAVRPVITLKKEVASEELEENTNSQSAPDSSNNIEEEQTLDDISNSNDIIISDKDEVDVPNTLLQEPFLSTIIGGVMLILSIVCTVVIINYKIENNK